MASCKNDFLCTLSHVLFLKTPLMRPACYDNQDNGVPVYFLAVDNKNDDLCEQAAMALESSSVVCCVSGQHEPLNVKHAIVKSSK